MRIEMRHFLLVFIYMVVLFHIGVALDRLGFLPKTITSSTFEKFKIEEIAKKPGQPFQCAMSCVHSHVCSRFLEEGEKCHLLARFEFQQDLNDNDPPLIGNDSLVTIEDEEEWSHIMLLGGVLKDEGSTAGVEVLNLKTMKQCSTSAPLPESAFGAAFFILGGQVHLVGGYRSQIDKRDLHLFDLKSRTWQTSDLFPTNLADAVVAQISHFWVLITGGSDTPNTTIVHVNGSVLPGPPLPFQIMRHCALGVDEEHVFIAGGSRDGLGPTKEAFILNWADQVWVKQEPMNIEQSFTVCETFIDKNNELSILVGQANFQIFTWSTKTWRSCPDMLETYTWARMSKYRGVLYLFGGETNQKVMNTRVYAFDPNDETWTETSLSMKTGRISFGLLKIPPGIAKC